MKLNCNQKSKHILITVIAFLCISALLATILVTQVLTDASGEVEDLKNSIVSDEDSEEIRGVCMSAGTLFGGYDAYTLSAEKFRLTDFTPDELTAAEESYREKVGQSFSAASSQYAQLNDNLHQRFTYNQTANVSYVVKDGFFRYDISEIMTDGENVVVYADVIHWQVYINEDEGEFWVYCPVNHNKEENILRKEDGQWKMLKMHFESLGMDGDVTKEARFATFAEALAYANTIQPENIYA